MSEEEFSAKLEYAAEPVGRWVLPGSNQYGGVAFDVFYKPNWFHRKMMEILMGWEYQDR
jgi:hypothetical protein